MATKAAKSITINATKYELANSLGVANGKLQLKAKDVVLDEIDAPGGEEFVITLDNEQDLSVAGSKSCTTFVAADLVAAIQAGKTIKIIAHEVLDSNDNYTNDVMLIPSCRYSEEAANIWMSADVNTMAGHKAWDIVCGYTGDISSVTFIDATNKPSIIEARLTSDMSLAQVGAAAGWRGMSFPAVTFSDIVDMLSDYKTVYIALHGSTNKLTAFAPLTLTRRFAADMWSPELTFVADGAVFTINDTPEIKRATST